MVYTDGDDYGDERVSLTASSWPESQHTTHIVLQTEWIFYYMNSVFIAFVGIFFNIKIISSRDMKYEAVALPYIEG